jgi:RimJ/RimL family protein N-acetyltransferase
MSSGSSDGVVTLRPSTVDDVPLIIAGRDAVFRRFIGEGSAIPRPKFCIVVDGSLVGRVDHDRDDDRWWLGADEVNIGYHVFPEHRGRGYATRAVGLVLERLTHGTDIGVDATRRATLHLYAGIHAENHRETAR